MNIAAICIVCMVTAIICRALSKESGEFASLLSVCTVILIGAAVIYAATDVLSLARKLYDSSLLDKQYFDIMIKGAGICIVTKTAADCCRDCGESALASSAEAAGRIAMLIIAFPLFGGVLSVIEELIA